MVLTNNAKYFNQEGHILYTSVQLEKSEYLLAYFITRW